MTCKFRSDEPSLSSRKENVFESRRVRTQPFTRMESIGAELLSASLIGVAEIMREDCCAWQIRQVKGMKSNDVEAARAGRI